MERDPLAQQVDGFPQGGLSGRVVPEGEREAAGCVPEQARDVGERDAAADKLCAVVDSLRTQLHADEPVRVPVPTLRATTARGAGKGSRGRRLAQRGGGR